DELVARCLEKDPAQRFADGAALVGALEAFITRSSMSKPVHLPRTPRRWPAMALGGALLIAAGAGGLTWKLRRATPPPSAARAVAVTELPVFSGARPEAVGEYQAGLQKIRDGNWQLARLHFSEAAKRDPNFAQAHMRWALTSGLNESP